MARGAEPGRQLSGPEAFGGGEGSSVPGGILLQLNKNRANSNDALVVV
jgi:hypothetical protein